MGKIIVLDPGHGLNEKGKYSRPLIDCTDDEAIIVDSKKFPESMYPHENDNAPDFYREDLGTLAIAKRTAAELECKGHKVYITRTDEHNAGVYLSSLSDNEWKKRHWKSWKWIKDFTDKKQADIFVSIHTNATKTHTGSGTACFWASAPNGVDLSTVLTQEINSKLGLKIRRIAKHRYLILRQACNGRAVLLECLFHDNIKDIKLLLTQQGINSMAQAIASGIDKYSLTF